MATVHQACFNFYPRCWKREVKGRALLSSVVPRIIFVIKSTRNRNFKFIFLYGYGLKKKFLKKNFVYSLSFSCQEILTNYAIYGRNFVLQTCDWVLWCRVLWLTPTCRYPIFLLWWLHSLQQKFNEHCMIDICLESIWSPPTRLLRTWLLYQVHHSQIGPRQFPYVRSG